MRKTGRQPKDPAMNALANELKSLKFSEAPDLESTTRELFDDLAHGRGEYPFRLVYQMPDYKTWVVRLYLGGAVRVIGYSSRLCDACRYADLAAMRFWKYRVRGACEPVDSNLNFGAENAKHDAEHEAEAVWLIDQIEKYLQVSGVLGDPKQSEIDRQKARRARDARRTVRHDLHLLIDGLNEKLDLVLDKLGKLQVPPGEIQAKGFSPPPDIRGVESRPPNETEKLIAAQVASLEKLFSPPA